MLVNLLRPFLDGLNFVSSSQEILSILKGRKLQRYVIGTLVELIKQKGEDDAKYSDKLGDWDMKNH